MYYLIDFENIDSKGLIGYNFVNKDDVIVLFYNSSSYLHWNETIVQDLIVKCNLEFIQLVQTRKNGLDFYIATYIGELLAKNPKQQVVIISKDNGYTAVKDYCLQHFKTNIYLAESIMDYINKNKKISINDLKKKKEEFVKFEKENEELINRFMKLEDLTEKELIRIDELTLNIPNETKNVIKKEILLKKMQEKQTQLTLKLKGIKTFSDEEINYICNLYKENIPFNTYTSLTKKFGKNLGHTIYHKLKD